jgi:hypothetical protein
LFLVFSSILLAGILSGQTITVTQPTTGVTWNSGGTYTITWTKTGQMDTNVKINLHQGSNHILTISDSAPNTGTFQWTVPTTLAAGTYQIRVRTLIGAVAGDSQPFTISKVQLVQVRAEAAQQAANLFKRPKLTISNVAVNSNNEGFVITFGYKNSGTGSLPKASEMPVKPTYRVLIDNVVLSQGNLFIPESPAPPGWAVDTFHGGTIKFSTGTNSGGFDLNWHLGNTLTVFINENKVGGMESDSDTRNLRQMALQTGYDAMINNITADWTQHTVSILIKIEGPIGSGKEFQFIHSGACNFDNTVKIIPGQILYTINHKLDCLQYRTSYYFEGTLLIKLTGTNTLDHKDIDHRNNSFIKTFTFTK